MGGDVVAREHAKELVLGVENGVEEEEGAALRKERDPFHLVFVAGVPLRDAEARLFVEHEAVVDAHGLHGGAARKNGLAAAAVAREVVVHDRPGEDHVVDVAEFLVNPDGRAAGSVAEVFEVFRLRGDGIEHAKARGDFLAHLLDHLFVRHFAVRAEREDDLHVFVGDAEAVHFVHEHGHEVKAVRDARRIVADEGDGVAGLDDFRDRGKTDRVVDGFENAFGDVFHDGEGLGADFLEDEFVVEFEGLAAAAVGKVKGADRHDE